MILAMDGACAACSVAVWRDGRCLAGRRELLARGHAERLMPMALDALAAADSTFADIDRIAVTVGPGSFTGVRTTLAAARGLALALSRPIVGVTTLEAVAHAALTAGARSANEVPCLVALDSRRADLYAQIFGPDGAPESKAGAYMPEALAAGVEAGEVLLAGNAARGLEPLLRRRGVAVARAPGDGNPDAAAVAALAAGRRPSSGAPSPLYLRAPDAVKPVAGGRLRR